jgi:hypothetical protein
MLHGHFENARPTTINGGANSTLTIELIAFECPCVHDRLLREPMSQRLACTNIQDE